MRWHGAANVNWQLFYETQAAHISHQLYGNFKLTFSVTLTAVLNGGHTHLGNR